MNMTDFKFKIPDNRHKNHILSSLHLGKNLPVKSLQFYSKAVEDDKIFDKDLGLRILDESLEYGVFDEFYHAVRFYNTRHILKKYYIELINLFNKYLEVKSSLGYEKQDYDLVTSMPSLCDSHRFCKIVLREYNLSIIYEIIFPRVLAGKIFVDDFAMYSLKKSIEHFDIKNEVKDILKNIEETETILRFSKILSETSPQQTVKPRKPLSLNTSLCQGVNGHRSGWSYVVEGMVDIHDEDGIILDDYVERTHSWFLPRTIINDTVPHKNEWVGFLHNPPYSPDWFCHSQSMQTITKSLVFNKSMEKCKCLFTLSKHHAKALQPLVNVPVYNLLHPTGECSVKFSVDKFFQNRKIVQLGYWLRKMRNIYDIETKYRKYWLIGQDYAKVMFQQEKIADPHEHHFADVKIIRGLNNDEYDSFLSDSIIVLNLYDSSANNAVIESIQRNIPIVVNNHPAVIEYLGKDYPLYYENPTEMQHKIHNDKLIREAHSYLKNMNKEFLSKSYFIKQFLQYFENTT